MPWNSFERAYFFGTECALQNDECMSDQEHALVSHSAGVDQAFIERYCAPPAGKYPGTVDRLGNVPIAVARCVLDRLARILPHGAHATPMLWTPPSNPQPVVVIGGFNAVGSIVGPKAGLCNVDNQLFVFSDQNTILKLDPANFETRWKLWFDASRDGNHSKFRYEQPVGCICPGQTDANDPLAPGQPLRYFLDCIAKLPIWHKPFANAKGQALLSDCRAILREPNSVAVISPRLCEVYKRFRDLNDPETNDGCGSDGGPSLTVEGGEPDTEDKSPAADHDAPEGGVSQTRGSGKQGPDPRYFGLVFLDTSGNPSKCEAAEGAFQAKWRSNYRQQNVIFLISGPDLKGVQAATSAVCDTSVALANSGYPAAALHPGIGQNFLYAYFDGGPSWSNAFYVGKGQHQRDRSHLSGVVQALGNGTALSGRKQTMIATYLGRPGKSVLTAPGDLFKRLISWNGPYGDMQSFVAENFLINHGYGSYSISNDTSGNGKYGAYRYLSRPVSPRIYDPTRSTDVQIWGECCEFFVRSGYLSNLLKASLLCLTALPFVKPFDLACVTAGLNLVPASAIGGVLLPHLTRTGSGDATITYNCNPNRCYRIELKFSQTAPEVRIVCRPLTASKTDIEKFIRYFSGKKKKIKNRGWPYVRPFAVKKWFSIEIQNSHNPPLIGAIRKIFTNFP